MKNTEIAFYSFKQFGYSLLHIGGNGDSVEVFCLFSMYLKNKTFKYLKNQSLSWQFHVIICTWTWEETMTMIMMENLVTKINMTNNVEKHALIG